MKSFFLSIFFILVSIFSQAQIAFEKRYTVAIGCGDAASMCKTLDGGFVMAGASYGSKIPIVIKVDSLGNLIWKKRYSAGPSADAFTDIICTSDHNLVLCGVTNNFDNITAKILILKIDSMGNFLWSRYLGAPTQQLYGYSIKETLDHNLIVYGNNSGASGNMTSLACITASGNFLWSHMYDSFRGSWVGEVIVCKDKGFLYTQPVVDSLSEHYIYVLKTDSIGHINWAEKILTNFSGANQDNGLAVRETSNYEYVIAGKASDGNLLLVKLDNLGNVLWTRKHDFGFPFNTTSLDNAKDGGFILSINTVTASGGYLIKTDSAGNIQWAKTYGQPDVEFEKVVALANGYAAFGLEGVVANHTVCFVRTDSLGATGCEQNIPFTSVTIPATVEPIGSEYPGIPDSAITFQSTSIAIASLTLCATGINDLNTQSDFDIFPNPSSGIFTVSSSSIISSLEVFDLLGNVVLEKTIHAKEQTVDLSFQSKGIYFVKVLDENGNYEVRKIVLQ